MIEAEQLVQEILQLIDAGKVKLPGLPDIAIRVRQVIQKESHNSSELARVIQADIPLAVRLVQVANSPMYRGSLPVEHIQAAVARLGLKVTKNLVTSFAVRRSFSGRLPLTRKLAENTWKHSIQVATIAYTLARVTPRLDPELAMLAGLVHDIGVLPVIAYYEQNPQPGITADKLDSLIQAGRIAFGHQLLRQWRFEDEFLDVVTHAEDWQYSSDGLPTYVDVVLIAQLLAFVVSRNVQNIPKPHEIPAYKKFPVFALGQDAYIELLSEAKDEMAELTQLLNAP